MRIPFAAILAAAVLFAGASAALCREPDDPKAASEAAKSAGTPVFVDLGSHGCIACKKMVPVLESLEKRFDGKLLVVFVDTDKHRDYALSLGVMAIPTQILYDKTGREAGRNVGYISEEDAAAMMREKGLIK